MFEDGSTADYDSSELAQLRAQYEKLKDKNRIAPKSDRVGPTTPPVVAAVPVTKTSTLPTKNKRKRNPPKKICNL